ncbi:DUF2568 domain-containing protein [Streptomyces sp. NPDC091279]|uniref:DUF2568 domain-containing protein n=1 Tax=unclassified Streptomyces TaxID=2593676 RepID=UPI003803BBF7
METVRTAKPTKSVKALNGGLLLLAEVGCLAGAARWGFARDVPTPFARLLAAAAPALLIGLWVLFGARRAKYRLRGGSRTAFEIAWFGAGVLALAGVGDTGGAVLLAALAGVTKATATRLGR